MADTAENINLTIPLATQEVLENQRILIENFTLIMELLADIEVRLTAGGL